MEVNRKIKAVIFDLDGVLVDTDSLHFHATNDALAALGERPLSLHEHDSVYRALPTHVKLEIMVERRGLPKTKVPSIRAAKAERTAELVARFVRPDALRVDALKRLRDQGLLLAVCSNATRASSEQMLTVGGYLDFLQFFLSNQDIQNPKPAPDIYVKAMDKLGVHPENTLIVEDSPAGLAAALASGAHTLQLAGPHQLSYWRIMHATSRAGHPTVVVPAAGRGSRFSDAGYNLPKPLIPVRGRPMLSLALRDFAPLDPDFIVLMQREHIETHDPGSILQEEFPRLHVLPVEGVTEGAACTALLAMTAIGAGTEVIFANSDQTVDFDVGAFVTAMRDAGADGGILVFRDPTRNPKWSFARTDAGGRVELIREKEPISDMATVGIYYFRRAEDFSWAAQEMIKKDIRTNREFYLAPVYNELIDAGKKVLVYEIPETAMHGLGTPDDLQAYLDLTAP